MTSTQGTEGLGLPSTDPNVVFVDSPRGLLDRGWDPSPVLRELAANKISAVVHVADSEQELRRIADDYRHAVMWPLNYSFDGTFTSTYIVKHLEQLGCSYIGCNGAGALLTSKLKFKSKLQQAGLSTPRWRELSGDSNVAQLADFSTPFFLKTEFTCDSAGVRYVSDASSSQSIVTELKHELNDKVYAEESAGTEEMTVGCIVGTDYELYAAMSMRAIGRIFIDTYAKHHNHAIAFSVPSNAAAQLAIQYVKTVVQELKLDGYFRIDTVLDVDGSQVKAIDLNIFPILNSDPVELSYLPMAFMMTYGCQYSDVIKAIMGTVKPPLTAGSTESRLSAYSRSSSLLTANDDPI